MLPEQPTKTTIFRPRKNLLEEPKPPGRMYGAYGDGVVYLILSFDNANRKEPLKVFVDELSYYPLRGVAEKLENEVMLDGFPGRNFSFRLSLLSGSLSFYITNNHVYIVEAISDDMSKPAPSKFLASFRLNGKPVGKEIAEELSDETPLVATGQQSSENSSAVQTTALERVFTGREVTRKAWVVAKPEPTYTEEARQRQVVGTVVLRGVFSSSGKVTSLRVLSGLPHGLTEKALSAARNIKFIPAMKDGKYASMYIQLEYNFNLY